LPGYGTTVARKPDLVTWQRVSDYIEARSGSLAVGLLTCFALSSLAIAARRPFGCDEIITVTLAHAATIKDVLAKFLLTFDQTPPLNAVLVKLLGSLFGWTELVARLPSLIFVTAGIAILFHRIKALTNGLFSLAALSVLLVTSLPVWAYEARPYALLFFASALALSFWTSPSQALSKNDMRNSLLFGLAIMLGIFGHYYGVLLIVPFALEELLNRGVRKLFSFRLCCGIVGLGVGLAIHLPFIRAASRFRQVPFWGKPSLFALQDSYVELLMPLILALACIVLLLACTSSRTGRFLDEQNPAERVGWLFVGIPIAGYVLARLVTHAFWPRYFVSFLAGFDLAFGCVLYRYYRNSPRAAMLVLAVAVPLFFGTAISHFLNARTPVVSKRAEESDFTDAMVPRFRQEKKQFVLLPTLRSYVEARYYAADPDMIRVLLPPDYPRWFLEQNPIGIRYFSMNELRRYARQTALIDPPAAVLDKIQKFGFRIHWQVTGAIPTVYLE
jgi:Dolichyl-phosphate-mannose-protein mannosyltransferase